MALCTNSGRLAVLAVSLTVLGAAGAAAQMPLPQSKIEVLLASPDALLVKDLYRVDDVVTTSLGMTVDVVIVSSKTPALRSERGVRIELRDNMGRDASSVSYLDREEVVALSQALGEMTDLATGWSTRDGARAIEAAFTSIDGFTVSFHQDARNQRAFLTSGFVDPVRRSFSVADLATVKVAIDQAVAILQAR
jgi:hypothetical protein